jgi:peptidoglycan/xylan/chitin deacetylase (PgdA/CDA1 family)
MKPLSPLTAALLKGCGTILGVGNGPNSLLVLSFHRVLPQPDPLLPEEPDIAKFSAEMDVLAALCRVLPVAEAVERLYRRTLPSHAACITFDDGYANNLTCAAPVLAARRLPATVFVATDYLRGGRMWNDTVIEAVRRAGTQMDLSTIGLGRIDMPDAPAQRRAVQSIIGALKYLPPAERERRASCIAEQVGAQLPADLMLSETGVKQLIATGIDVGSHTLSHPILAEVNEAEAQREISASKSTLESISGTPVALFAYPNGKPGKDYQRSHVEMVRRAGFQSAFSSAWGVCRVSSDRFQLPRMRPWERSAPRFAGRLLYTRRAATREDTA